MLSLSYCCDAGSVAIRIGTSTIRIRNGYGDGDFKILIVGNDYRNCDFSKWKFIGTSICGPVKFDVLDYDCSGGKVIETIDLGKDDEAYFYKNNNGDILIYIRKGGN